MKKRLFIIIGALAMLFNLFGCKMNNFGEKGDDGLGKRAKNNETKIVRYRYSYNNSFGACSYSYDIKLEDGKYILEYESMEFQDYGVMTIELDEDFMAKLKQLYLDHNIARWNGYSKYNPNVLDGDGFGLSINFEDGEGLSASGSNTFPEGYGDYTTDVDDLFEPITTQLKEQEKQKFIDTGINGKLDFIMINFFQHGNSGKDSYSIFITQKGVRDNNFDCNLKSVSGDFIEPGEYRYYCEISNDDIGFEDFDEIIRKYDLIKWYNFDETAEDYNNEEWFQMDFGYDDGLYLKACGTKHPENYDEFRQEFLSLLFNKIKTLEEAGKLKIYE